MAYVRAIACQRNLNNADGTVFNFWRQSPFAPQSVFGFYAPTDRAPGSNLLAPEQKLVNADELSSRFGDPNGFRWVGPGQPNSSKRYLDAGCDVAAYTTAIARSPAAFIDLVSLRFFRGAMPPTLRSYLEQLIRERTNNQTNYDDLAMQMLGFALASPYYGVIK
jgi:hypothetical protein